MDYHYNQAGYCGELREQPLEPADCWGEEPAETYGEEYDRVEDEMSGRTRFRLSSI